MVTDRLTVGGDPVHLGDIQVPFLTVRANRDHIVPPEATAPLIDLVGSPDKHELCLDAGHMGLVVGRTAARTTVPTIIDFVRRRSDPLDGAARGRPDVQIEQLGPERCDALLRFFGALPEGDRTFIKEDVTDPDTVRSWATDDRRRRAVGGGRAVGRTASEVTGYVAVRPLPGWSDHVGEVRLVVSPTRRGSGLGRELARRALVEAVSSGLSKLVVEVVAEQGAALALFTDLGFSGEALLRDHIRDRSGELRDLMVLAHHVRETWAGMDTVGIADELEAPAG